MDRSKDDTPVPALHIQLGAASLDELRKNGQHLLLDPIVCHELQFVLRTLSKKRNEQL